MLCLQQPRLPYLEKQWKEAALFERKLPLFCACSCHVQNLDSDHLIRVQVSPTTSARVDNSCCVGFIVAFSSVLYAALTQHAHSIYEKMPDLSYPGRMKGFCCPLLLWHFHWERPCELDALCCYSFLFIYSWTLCHWSILIQWNPVTSLWLFEQFFHGL